MVKTRTQIRKHTDVFLKTKQLFIPIPKISVQDLESLQDHTDMLVENMSEAKDSKETSIAQVQRLKERLSDVEKELERSHVDSLDPKIYGHSFIDRVKELQLFKKKFGDCIVTPSSLEDKGLYNWVTDQRRLYR